jgi:hypothetical protein
MFYKKEKNNYKTTRCCQNLKGVPYTSNIPGEGIHEPNETNPYKSAHVLYSVNIIKFEKEHTFSLKYIVVTFICFSVFHQFRLDIRFSRAGHVQVTR